MHVYKCYLTEETSTQQMLNLVCIEHQFSKDFSACFLIKGLVAFNLVKEPQLFL